jgi:hypothetical protein
LNGAPPTQHETDQHLKFKISHNEDTKYRSFSPLLILLTQSDPSTTYGSLAHHIIFLFYSIIIIMPPPKKVKKVMTLPINVIFSCLQKKTRVRLWLYEDARMQIEGQIIGFDEYMK